MRKHRRNCRGRVLMEVLVSMVILGAFLAGIGDTYRQGSRVRRRIASEASVRRTLANRLAQRRAEIQAGVLVAGKKVALEPMPELLPGMSGQIQTLVAEAEAGVVSLELVGSWKLGEHEGVERRRLLVAAGGR